jgi:signal transduction histidine kinase
MPVIWLAAAGARRLLVSMSNRRTEDSSTRQSLQVAKIAVMSKLAAGVAHEINNPCGVLLMKLKFLLSIAEEEHLSARAIATLEVAADGGREPFPRFGPAPSRICPASCGGPAILEALSAVDDPFATGR